MFPNNDNHYDLGRIVGAICSNAGGAKCNQFYVI